MDNIKIVKLRNGEDLVGTLTSTDIGNYRLEEPMSFEIDFRHNSSGLIMRHWLPVQLVKKNEIELTQKDIMAIIEPADDFCEYYWNTVEKIKDLLKAKNLVDDMSDEEIDMIMNEFEDMDNNGSTLH
jgi:SAM-dependent MidA family methyltransferase